MSRTYVAEVTPEEQAFGFTVAEAGSGVQAAIYSLGEGLFAVKLVAVDGSVKYAVCNDRLAPLYASACSLDELRERFSKPRADSA